MRRALFQEQAGEGRIRCRLCPHCCLLGEGQTGRCGVRRVERGCLVSLVYDRIAALHADPVEKKPFFHVLPGTRTLSFAAPGCNLPCAWCQNASLSQCAGESLPGRELAPDGLVALAHEQGCPSLAATYSEPTVFFELAQAVGRCAAAAGLLNLWVTNGFLSAEARRELAGWLDAANVDLKSMKDETYRAYCGGRLAPVLATLEELHAAGVWLEVTTLLIPGLNDSPDELGQAARFLARLDPELPWHLTAFHPEHRVRDRPRTPPETLERAVELGREAGLEYVYAGNVELAGGGTTRCPGCGAVVVERRGLRLAALSLVDGACPACGTRLAGRWGTAGRS